MKPISCAAALAATAAAWVLRLGEAAVLGPPMRGICYGPAPLRIQGEGLPLDDFMSEAAKPLWGPRGRGDLQIIRDLGANVVRLYGNDPRQDHSAFLAEAEENGIGAIPGQSDWPFLQMQGNCMATSFNCYTQIKASFLDNLRNGWLQDGAYHPAIRHIIVMNEPDLKFGNMDPRAFGKALISAVDAMLDAETEANVTGNRVNFTVTFSFGVCASCEQAQGSGLKPALGQMIELRKAFLHPEDFSYNPRNDLAAFYKFRFINSFNTNNPSNELPGLILDLYEREFPTVPIFIEEYHCPRVNQLEDLPRILQIAAASPLVLGVAFFEYQVRYDKGGDETAFGMFGLGDYVITDMTIFQGPSFHVWCLTPMQSTSSGRDVAADVAAAYGGVGVDLQTLCTPNPRKVLLNEDGFNRIFARRLEDPTGVAAFIQRVVEHLGAQVVDENAFQTFARTVTSFQDVEALDHPAWLAYDEYSACIADRLSDAGSVGRALEQLRLTSWFNFSNTPAQCKDSTWKFADYVLSVYYNQQGNQPLIHCYFGGSATLADASRKVQRYRSAVRGHKEPVDYTPHRRGVSGCGAAARR